MRREFITDVGTPSLYDRGPASERGLKIKLPKIKIGKFIGSVVKKVVPGGGAIVDAANAAISITKKAKITLPKVLKASGEAAVDAAGAQIQDDLTTAAQGSAATSLANLAGGNNLVPILLVGVIVVLLVRRK